MVVWTPEQRRTLIDKLSDGANMALGALLFGQFLSERPFSALVAVGGIATWAALFGSALWLGGQRR